MTLHSIIRGSLRVAPRSSTRVLAAGAIAAAALACGTKDAAGPLSPTGPIGRVRFVNVITDTTRGRVNAILAGLPFGVNLTYTTSTPATLPSPSTAFYSAVYAGDRSIVLKRTIDTTVVVATLNFTIAVGQDRTVYAIGGAGGSAVSSFVTTDDNQPATATTVRLRAVNASPTAGPLDIFVTATNADLATATPVATGLAFQAASAYFTVAPGTYQIRAVPAGTAPANRATAVTITLNSQVFAGGTGRTIVTADNNVGGAPLRAFMLSDR
jgi:hypothetical protein